METAKENLLNKLRTRYDTFTDGSHMVHNLDFLEEINPGFVATATNLIDTCNFDQREATVGNLRSWISDGPNVPAAYQNAEGLNNQYGTSYDEARYILEEAIKTKSMEGIFASSDKIPKFRTRGQKLVADILVIQHFPEIRPDLLSASTDEIDRYCHPLVVAASITLPRINEDRFVREGSIFIAWAAGQEEMPEALASALITNSTDPDTITALMGMRMETAMPLHDGLI